MEPRTLVYYHIPGDHDDPGHPNVYAIMKPPETIKLRDVRGKFPLPGKYHFRFKLKSESGELWMDITNDDSFVPVVNTHVIAKVLRISWLNSDSPSPSVPSPTTITSDNAVREFSKWNGSIDAMESSKNGTPYSEPIFTTTIGLPSQANTSYIDSPFPRVPVKTVIQQDKTREEDILRMFDASPPQIPSKPANLPKDDFDLIFR
ncbi:hypothetical protein IE077_000098 [Cardiosporidium cionae]|uniref:DIX domain-containing protein n=1 Tax=Cardiosporidium cionae TaxID=476202 RepID=A0ABQ7J6L1_9APIC|nr:hypothetical protein IE077_000098 [Cardiosporidium cionae]|eukprot:KAF8819325.1 hypothetical protein IE077_000098 [Cardiosporidium cionae]